MYLPKQKKKLTTPFDVRDSRRYLFSMAQLVVAATILGSYKFLMWIQQRGRSSDTKIGASRTGKRVAVVGGGMAGCCVAAALTAEDPNVQVTVFEPRRTTTLTTLIPYASVGTRSYDLNTFEGHDSLSSPTTWNVTRDAKLVLRSVDRVYPEQNKLRDSAGDEYSYDCLVLATGTTADFRSVRGLQREDYDRNGVAVAPGVTRDHLGHIYEGNIVHVKVPPRDPREVFLELVRSGESTAASTAKGLSRARWWNLWSSGHSDTTATAPEKAVTMTSPSFDSRQLALPLSATHGDGGDGRVAVVPDVTPFLGQQHPATFISTCNTIWKYLDYYRKTLRCPLICVSSEGTVSDMLPSDYVDVVTAFWSERKLNFLGRTVIDSVHPSDKVVALKNLDSGTTVNTDYRILVLDLPRLPSPLAAVSGLSAPEVGGYVPVNPCTLQHRQFPNVFALGDGAALPTVPTYAAAMTQAPVVSHNVRQFLSGKPLTARYDGYSSFNVVMTTWRHMWPEVSWSYTDESGPTSPFGLRRRNEHVWDNTKWRDIRGVVQGTFVQLFGLEFTHWFVFQRGWFYPPTWFHPPSFPE